MTPNDEADRLMADFLAGGLDPQGAGRLHAILVDNPARLRELASLVQLDGTLRSLGEEPDAGLLMRQLEARLHEDPRMVDAIVRRFEGTPEPGLPSARPRRIARAPARTGSPALLWAAVAAGVLFAIILLVSMPGRSQPPVPKGETVRKPVPPPEPPPAGEPERPSPTRNEPAPPPKPEEPRRETPAAPPSPPQVPNPPDPVPAPPAVPPPTAKPTVTVIARVERAQGDVLLASGAPALRGLELTAAQGLRTVGSESAAVLQYPDGTRLELSGDTTIAALAERAGGGKSLTLGQGHIQADVAKQPAGQPFILSTPLAEATVLGTRFTLSATADATRLEVREGKVRLTRLADKRSAEVSAGRFAVAAPKGDVVARPILEIPAAGLILWLKADALPPVAGAVAQWPDASPARSHAFQPAAAACPARVVNAVNGLPALRFDGVNDAFKLPPGFRDFTRGVTAFLVFKPAAAKEWSGLFDIGEGTEHNTLDLSIDGPSNTIVYDVHWKREKEAKNQLRAPGGATLDQWQRVAVVHAGGTPGTASAATLYKNGVPVASGVATVPDTVARGSNLIGSGNGAVKPHFHGEIAEIILYASALGEPERQQVEQYLSRKYFPQ